MQATARHIAFTPPEDFRPQDQALQLRYQHCYYGPSIYAQKPVLTAWLSIPEDLPGKALPRIARINSECQNWFHWSADTPLDGAAVADFIVNFARALLSEVRGSITTAYIIPKHGHYLAVLGYHHLALAMDALKLAGQLLMNIDTLSRDQMDEQMAAFWQLCRREHPNLQSQCLLDYCDEHHIPYRPVMRGSCWQFGAGARSVIFNVSSPITDNFDWTHDKAQSKRLFATLNAPIVTSQVVAREDQLAEAVAKVGFPCVVKPLKACRGLGVLTRLHDLPSVVQAFHYAKKFTPDDIMVERYIEGEIHRLIVVRGKLWKVIRRDRPCVIGDGVSTVQALAEARNRPLEAKKRPNGNVGPSSLDMLFVASLHSQGLTPQSVPQKGQKVIIRNVATAKEGSSCEDMTGRVHADTVLMAENLARYFGIEVCGLDLMSEDATRSCFEIGAFIEINSGPGLMTPQYAGIPRDEVARTILGPVPARIPTLLVLAGAQHHDAIRAAIPAMPGLGWVCGAHSGIGQTHFPLTQKAPIFMLEPVLRSPLVTAVLIVCDSQMLSAYGMPVVKADTTIIYDNPSVEDSWREVLARQSDRILTVTTPGELAAAFAKFG